MRASIAVLGGDGIGPEVTAEAVGVLKSVAARYVHEFNLQEAPFGGIAIDQGGDPLPPRTLELCLGADAVLLGAIGGPKWSSPQARVRPEQAAGCAGAGRLRQSAPGVRAPCPAPRLHAQSRGDRRGRPAVRP
jgi:isocitrate/isopropylmalate dehydrogenase